MSVKLSCQPAVAQPPIKNKQLLICRVANPASAFGGPAIPAFIQRVQEQGSRFHRPPIPPLGCMLTLVDEADAGDTRTAPFTYHESCSEEVVRWSF